MIAQGRTGYCVRRGCREVRRLELGERILSQAPKAPRKDGAQICRRSFSDGETLTVKYPQRKIGEQGRVAEGSRAVMKHANARERLIGALQLCCVGRENEIARAIRTCRDLSDDGRQLFVVVPKQLCRGTVIGLERAL